MYISTKIITLVFLGCAYFCDITFVNNKKKVLVGVCFKISGSYQVHRGHGTRRRA